MLQLTPKRPAPGLLRSTKVPSRCGINQLFDLYCFVTSSRNIADSSCAFHMHNSMAAAFIFCCVICSWRTTMTFCPLRPVSARLFIALRVNKTACPDYWKGVLDGANESRLILHPRPSYSNSMDSIIFRNTPRLQWTRIGFPFPCVLKFAWGIVLGELVNDSDVTFGEIIANRRVPMDNAYAVLGSCINMVPVRVKMDHGQKPREIMTELKEQSFLRLPYESSPFDVMMEGCTSWSRWPRFSSVVVYQNIPMNDYYLEKTPILLGDDECELTWMEPTWDMLIWRLSVDRIRIKCGSNLATAPELYRPILQYPCLSGW